jgi:hypothetical protein
MSMSCLLPVLMLALSAQVAGAQVVIQPIPPPDGYALPDFSGSPIADCPWPQNTKGLGPRVRLASTDGTLRLPASPQFRPAPSSTGERWKSKDGKWWLSANRGETYEFGERHIGAWSLLTGLLPDSSGSTSICLNDCLRITNRCHEVWDGRDVYVAWGQFDGGWDNHAYVVIAAFSLGYDTWLVLSGGGPSENVVDRLLSVIHSVEL